MEVLLLCHIPPPLDSSAQTIKFMPIYNPALHGGGSINSWAVIIYGRFIPFLRLVPVIT